MYDFRRITLFCLEYRVLKHKITIHATIWVGRVPLVASVLGGYWNIVDGKGTLVLFAERCIVGM